VISQLAPRFSEREQLVDSGFEIWSSGSALTNWSTSGVVTVAQDAVEKFAGTYSCKATRSDGVTFSSVTSGTFNLPLRSWVFVAARAKGTSAVIQGLRLRFFNPRTGLSWSELDQDWNSGGSFYRNVIPTDYTRAAGWIPLFDGGLLGSDVYRMELAGYFPGGESVWYDDATVFGPFVRPISQLGLAPLTYHGYRDGRRSVFAA
jgi:hypothetical protein